MKNKNRIYVVIAVLIVLSSLIYFSNSPSKYDEFANCLTANEATFYGTFWCPHCADQKKAFGSSMKNILYVECSTEDKKGQTQPCIDANITSYPTWTFKDESKLSGFVPFEVLAEKTGCELP